MLDVPPLPVFQPRQSCSDTLLGLEQICHMYIYFDNDLVEVVVKTVDPVGAGKEENGEGKNTHH